MKKFEDEHDCANCPTKTRKECNKFNKQKIDAFISIKTKMTTLILESSEVISQNGDRDVYHYFNELKAFLQAQMDLMSSSGWISKEDIEVSDKICEDSYKEEMDAINEVQNYVHTNPKKR